MTQDVKDYGFRTDNVFGLISTLLKCDQDYKVKFTCGEETYEIVTGVFDSATKSVIFDLKEIHTPTLDEQYMYILEELKENPSLTAARFSKEDIRAAIDWGLCHTFKKDEED